MKHLEYKSEVVPDHGVMIYNRFEADGTKVDLEFIIQSGALNEDYFYDEKYLTELKIEQEKYLEEARKYGTPIEDENPQLATYGPLLRAKLEPSDFTLLSFSSLSEVFQSYINEWKNKGWSESSRALKLLFEQAFFEFNIIDINNREYFFLDSELLNVGKLIEYNYYDYFITIVSTLKESADVIILNFYND